MKNNSISPEIISILRKQAKKYNFKLLAIFGSYARNEQTCESDIDLLVKFNEIPSLITFIQIEHEISEALNLKVDLVTENSLNKYIKNQILSEMQVVYSEK